jgi:hypothetical protein
MGSLQIIKANVKWSGRNLSGVVFKHLPGATKENNEDLPGQQETYLATTKQYETFSVPDATTPKQADSNLSRVHIFNDPVGNSDYMTQDDRMTVNNELERMW